MKPEESMSLDPLLVDGVWVQDLAVLSENIISHVCSKLQTTDWAK